VAKKKGKGAKAVKAAIPADETIVAEPVPVEPPVAFTRPLPLPTLETFVTNDWRAVVRRLTGARLVYGKPIEAAGRTVVPVASLRVGGGGGFGSGSNEGSQTTAPGMGRGVGGGGALEAKAVGFIDIGPDGARYEAIDKTGRLTDAIAKAASNGGVAGGAAAGALAGATVVAGAVGILVARRRSLMGAAVRAALPGGSRGSALTRALRR
jgi:uncharacterized spore protein YtfJ